MISRVQKIMTMWKKTPGLDNVFIRAIISQPLLKPLRSFSKKTKEDNKKENRDWENIREAMKNTDNPLWNNWR